MDSDDDEGAEEEEEEDDDDDDQNAKRGRMKRDAARQSNSRPQKKNRR
jgi:hypothetical protein